MISRGFGKNSNIVSRGLGARIGDIIISSPKRIIRLIMRINKFIKM